MWTVAWTEKEQRTDDRHKNIIQKTTNTSTSKTTHHHQTHPPPSRTKQGLIRNLGDPRPVDYGKNNIPPPELLEDSKSWNHLIIVPEYKLMFCFIEKVACSMFHQLFRLLRIYHPDVSTQEVEYLASNMWERNTPQHHFFHNSQSSSSSNITKKKVSQIFTDNSWTKVVYFRDPADRFLSAFQSKCGGIDKDGKSHCRKAFGTLPAAADGTKNNKTPLLWNGTYSDFQRAIDIATSQPTQVFRDVHFRPAHQFCGGLSNTLDYYHMVHKLDRHLISNQIRELFHRLSVNETLTEGLIDRVVQTGGVLQESDKEYVLSPYGVPLEWSVTTAHNTESQMKGSSSKWFGSSESLERLQSVYKSDSDLFQLQPIPFDELQESWNK